MYNLFDGFATKADIQSAFLQTQIAKNELENAKREYQRDMRNLAYELKQIDSKLSAAQNLAQHSNKLAVMNDKLHTHHETDRLAVLESQITRNENLLKLKEASLQMSALGIKAKLMQDRLASCI